MPQMGSVLQTMRTNVMSNNWTDVSAPLIREGAEDQPIDPAIMEGNNSDEGSSYYSAEGEESEWEED